MFPAIQRTHPHGRITPADMMCDRDAGKELAERRRDGVEREMDFAVAMLVVQLLDAPRCPARLDKTLHAVPYGSRHVALKMPKPGTRNNVLNHECPAGSNERGKLRNHESRRQVMHHVDAQNDVAPRGLSFEHDVGNTIVDRERRVIPGAGQRDHLW